MAERLEDFVERGTRGSDGELRRGVALSKPEEVKDLIERYSKGEKNKALESWTSEKFVSDRFAAGNRRFPKAHRVTIVVENNTKGAPINAISGFDDEFETPCPVRRPLRNSRSEGDLCQRREGCQPCKDARGSHRLRAEAAGSDGLALFVFDAEALGLLSQGLAFRGPSRHRLRAG